MVKPYKKKIINKDVLDKSLFYLFFLYIFITLFNINNLLNSHNAK